MNAHVVVAGAARSSPLVLDGFLRSVDAQASTGLALSYLLVDDTAEPRANALLARFSAQHPHCRVLPSGPAAGAHEDWSNTRDPEVWRRAAIKDFLMAQAFSVPGATHVLLVDSNLLLPPPLVRHLAGLGKDIVSEVYWTEWSPGEGPLPSVWQCDEYSFAPADLARAADAEKAAHAGGFLSALAQPGTYEVGGVSGCVLVSAAAWQAGVSFKRLANVSFWGDDRHFSIRAAALGFNLFADTHYPPLHLYRDEDIGRSMHFWARWGALGEGPAQPGATSVPAGAGR